MPKKHKIAAVIVAAGKGKRVGAETPKQYLNLEGIPVLRHTVDVFLEHPDIEKIVVVINPDHADQYYKAVEGLDLPLPAHGGETRQESVKHGLEALEEDPPDLVLIHDAVRPFVSHDLISRVIEGLDKTESVMPVMPVSDSIKRLDEGHTMEAVDRSNLIRAQTPQGFHFKNILTAHKMLKGRDFTDDVALMAAEGMSILTVPGEGDNFKITTANDVVHAELMINKGYETRFGLGLDIHRFSAPVRKKDNKIMLCGVAVPFEKSLDGHSDADVGLHAIVDALLGAMAAGDIGQHFPPDDPQWKDADSAQFVEYAMGLLKKHEGRVVNIDLTLVCEAPKISPHHNTMEKRVAELLDINPGRVSVKATTTEKLGFIGQGEGMAAEAIITIRWPKGKEC